MLKTMLEDQHILHQIVVQVVLELLIVLISCLRATTDLFRRFQPQSQRDHLISPELRWKAKLYLQSVMKISGVTKAIMKSIKDWCRRNRDWMMPFYV